MRHYSVQPRDQIFVKGCAFLSFAKIMGKNIVKKISKNLSSKYCQKILDHAKESNTNALRTASKRATQKKQAEATGGLIGNKIADKITRASETSAKYSSETNEEKMLRRKYISPELRQKIY